MLSLRFSVLMACLFGSTSCLRLAFFLDFLAHNRLNHGIIIMCAEDVVTRDELKVITATEHYWLSFFNIDRTSPDDGIATFKNLFYHGAPKVGVTLDIKCQRKSILEFASSSNLFNASQAWFILADSTVAGLNALQAAKINIDANVTLGVRVPNEDKLRLYDLFKVCHQCGCPLQCVAKGNWSVRGGMEIRTYFQQTPVQRRRNFSGISLGAGVVINSAPKGVQLSEYLEGFSNKHLDAMQRKTYHLLKIMKDMYKFQLKVVISDSWGVQQDGNWTGVMGNLVNGEVDISLSPLRFTQQRVLAVRYLPEVHVEMCVLQIRFLFRHPRRSPIRNIFLQPFTSSVWYTVLAFIAAGVLLMAITMHHENERYGTADGCSENKLDFFTLIILEAIFLQGPSGIFRCGSTRTLIISICIFAVMLFQFYSAFIVGSLLADVPRTIVNMPALFNSTLDIGMEDIAYNYEFFINTSNQMAKDIYVHRVMRNPRSNILPLQKGLERLGRGGYAYHVAVVRAYGILKERLSESAFCELQEVAMDPPFASCAAVPHGSPYKEHFASAILQFRETGIMNYHNDLWAVEKPHCSQEMMEKDTTVDMEHFLPALGFLLVAMLLSGAVCGAEFLAHSLNKFHFKQVPLARRCLHR